MDNSKCKNRKCGRVLPLEYKHRYCESCRNERVKRVQDAGKVALGFGVMVGGPIIAAVIKGSNKVNKKE